MGERPEDVASPEHGAREAGSEPDSTASTEPRAAARAKQLAAHDATDPERSRSGGVSLDP